MSVLEDFFANGNEIKPTEISPEYQLLIENWLAAIDRQGVGFLPRSIKGHLYWYAFSGSARDQRELLTLLDGWIGPTYSDLSLRRGQLDLLDPFDSNLNSLPTPPLRFEVLPYAHEKEGHARERVRTALQVLSRLISSRPVSEFNAPRTTVEVLDDLGHAISVSDRDIALGCLRELESSADLDQINLAFLRLRIFAGLEDWKSILSDRDLEHLLAMRRPLGITRVIQHAVYNVYLKAADESEDEARLLESALSMPTELRRITTDAIPTRRSEFVVETLLSILAGKSRHILDRLFAQAEQFDVRLLERLTHIRTLQLGKQVVTVAATDAHSEIGTPPTSHDRTEEEQSLAEAKGLAAEGNLATAIALGLSHPPHPELVPLLVVWAHQLADPTVALAVSSYLESNGLRKSLGSSHSPLSAVLAWLDNVTAPQTQLGWRGWIDLIWEESREVSLNVDPQVSADWELLSKDDVKELFETASDTFLGRIGEQAGPFMAAHREVFATSEAPSLIERILAGLAMSGKQSVGVRVQTLALLEFLAEANADSSTMSSALDWTGEIVAQNVSAGNAIWAVDVLQAATNTPLALAAPAKHQLFFQIVDLVRPVRSALDLGDLEAIKVVAEELTLTYPDDFIVNLAEDADPAEAFRCLEGMYIVLYSLTESATTRAAQVLRKILPGISVKTIAAHGGNPQLAAASENADVFVVVTASATHAATDFIKEHRGNKALINVNSRGSSMILKGLADWAMSN